MRSYSRRLAVAAALVALAVIVPLAAWYVTGSANVEREAERLQRMAFDRARETAGLLSLRTATRLENLREAEAGCSYLHYQHVTTGETVECDCPSLEPPGDPEPETGGLALARFQIEEDGSVFHALSCTDAATAEGESLAASVASLGGALVLSLDEPPYLDEVLEGAPSSGAHDAAPFPYHGESLLTQGPFVWRTVAVQGVPTLTAVRKVLTDARTLVQGFVVSGAALEESLRGHGWLVHGMAEQEGEADLPIPGTAWRVVVDPNPALQEAARQATAVRNSFLRRFAFGTIAAILAGACLLALFRQSERLAQLRARFSAAAAHELRSPLATIRLHSEMLADNLGKPELAREYAERVAGEVERLGRVVSNTLGYARLEQGRLEVACETGDLAGAVRQTLEIMRPALEQSGVKVDLHVENDLPPVRFDPEAVHHVLQNLLDNAEKFSRHCPDRTVHVELTSWEDHVLLAVSDHGPGVPGPARRRLFRPFAQEAGEGANEGLGLGLVLVQALVQAMDGSVTYADAEGGGARFTVRLNAEEPLEMDTPD